MVAPLLRPLVGHYHVPFWLRAHSRSLSASNSTNNSSKAPIMMHFHFYLENLHNKNPCIIARKIQTMFWGKSKFVGRGNPSAWSVAGCWIIAGGWFQSQHCRPNFHYQFLPNNNNTLFIHFNVTPISLHHTSIIQNQRTARVYRCNIQFPVKQCSVTCGAICLDVLAWRDTGSSPLRSTQLYFKNCLQCGGKHSRVGESVTA